MSLLSLTASWHLLLFCLPSTEPDVPLSRHPALQHRRSRLLQGYYVLELDTLSFHRTPVGDVLVTRSTEDQSLTMACRHAFDPFRFFPPCVPVQVFQCPDVMHLDLVSHMRGSA